MIRHANGRRLVNNRRCEVDTVSSRRFSFPSEVVLMRQSTTGYESVPLPWPAMAGLTAEQWSQCRQIYEAALEQTLGVLRPSLLERDVLGVWN
jgi:hypothetical protein